MSPQPQQVVMAADDPTKDGPTVGEVEDQMDAKANPHEEVTPRAIQNRFDLLRDLTDEEMTALDKRVVRKLDWRMMPMITMMYLMRYVSKHPRYLTMRFVKSVAVTLTGSTSQTLGLRGCKRTCT